MPLCHEENGEEAVSVRFQVRLLCLVGILFVLQQRYGGVDRDPVFTSCDRGANGGPSFSIGN